MSNRVWLVLMGLLILLAACGEANETPPEPSPIPPTTQVPPSPTLEVAAAPTLTPGGPTLTPSRTPPPTVTPMPSATPELATSTPAATATPGAYEHMVQTGEDCIGIAAQYGYRDFTSILHEIEVLNNISCRALPAGQKILVPRQTATPTPEGYEVTQTAIATSIPPMVTLSSGPSFAVATYVLQEDDTLSSISINHDSSLRQICELNPLPEGLDCSGCVWEQPNCCCPDPPLIVPGKVIYVPVPPPTPTYTPTFTGSETPTSTPTPPAPRPVYPPNGATVAGPVRLMWLTSGVLEDDEVYLIMVRDTTTEAQFSTTTRQLSLDIPPEYLPDDGQAHTFVWQVSVGRIGSDGLFYPSGSAMAEQQFFWSGWPKE